MRSLGLLLVLSLGISVSEAGSLYGAQLGGITCMWHNAIMDSQNVIEVTSQPTYNDCYQHCKDDASCYFFNYNAQDQTDQTVPTPNPYFDPDYQGDPMPLHSCWTFTGYAGNGNYGNSYDLYPTTDGWCGGYVNVGSHTTCKLSQESMIASGTLDPGCAALPAPTTTTTTTTTPGAGASSGGDCGATDCGIFQRRGSCDSDTNQCDCNYPWSGDNCATKTECD